MIKTTNVKFLCVLVILCFFAGYGMFAQEAGIPQIPDARPAEPVPVDQVSASQLYADRSSIERRAVDQRADLIIESGDLILEQRYDSGFHLFVRKKPGLGSVLITETTRDPALLSDNYAYRAAEWNPINGDEIRVINDRPIPRENNLFSLISSTVEPHAVLGEAFHIFIPWVLQFGHENTRHGQIYVGDGTYLNLRTFSLPYADYRGLFHDNPYALSITQKPNIGPSYVYQRDAVTAFRAVAETGRGHFVRSVGPDDLVEKIRSVLEDEAGKSVDIVFCLDTTESMTDDIERIRAAIVPMLKEITGLYTDFRLGLVLYKDYFDEYLTRVVGFTKDFAVFQRNLNAIRVRGGRDMPEAVYEALHEGTTQFPWEMESRVLILIGDAPPHPIERGNITKSMVDSAVQALNITVSAIILPQ